jgi:methyl-accepting chemotaxis protein
MTEIVDSIKKVAAVVSDIAAASAEQAAGIEQVNKALTQMDEVTQQNSALVEENAATAKTLEHQSSAMNEEVSVFRVSDTDAQRGQGRVDGHSAPATKLAPVAAAKAAPAKLAAAVRGGAATPARGGPVGRMQAALATAVAVNEPQWQEF